MGELVDAARMKALEEHRNRWDHWNPEDCEDPGDECDTTVAVDQLILAVRAELPCEKACAGCDAEGYDIGPCKAPDLCITCEARAALKETLGA